MRETLRRLFAATLRDLDVDAAVRGAVADRVQVLARSHPLLVIALGKAARPMAAAVRDSLPDARLRGLVAPPEPDTAALPPFEVIAGGHPLPTSGSLRVGARALALAQSATRDEVVVFLISGGGSAICEVPADGTVTLDELRTLHRALIASGADIAAMNTVRRHLSAVKGGRLALAAAAAHRQITLAISDVAGDDHSALASGPTTTDHSTVADCRAVLDRFALWPAVPRSLRARLERDDLPEPWRPERKLGRTEFHVLQDNRLAREHLARHARAVGMHVIEDQSVDDLPYDIAAERLLARLGALHAEHTGHTVAVLTGGEVTVKLPGDPGLGGRNQQFALACALRIAGEPIAVLSAGTDGIDGSSMATGAVADGSTIARARALGLDAIDCLRRCDAHPLFAELCDAIVTGATGQNVRDLRLLVRTR